LNLPAPLDKTILNVNTNRNILTMLVISEKTN